MATEDHKPLLILVHAGSMDDPSRFEPTADIFASRAQPWNHMNPELPKMPGMPRYRTTSSSG